MGWSILFISSVHSTPFGKAVLLDPIDLSSMSEGPLSAVEPMSGVESFVEDAKRSR